MSNRNPVRLLTGFRFRIRKQKQIPINKAEPGFSVIPMTNDDLILISALSVGFPVMWFGVLFGMSRIGPWYSLSKRFPFRSASDCRRFWVYHLGFRTGYYGFCVYADADRDQLTLYVVFPFRPFHPPITIPRDAVSRVELSSGILFPTLSCLIDGHALTLSGPIARAEFWQPSPVSA